MSPTHQPATRFRPQRVAQARGQRGLTQDQLARLVQRDQSTVARVESGDARPSMDLLERIARHLRVDIRRFFGR